MDKTQIKEYLEEGARLRKLVNVDELYEIGMEIAERMIKGKATLMIFGNGGSAADAQHIAEEFFCYCSRRHRNPLPAIA
ncbi:phosphoheptose isomerase, partial [Candidatus Marsarchaeota archaeon]|nr:phosphoheptose isomerase [Candidatus Marsarchaeota archaeon]